jgi:hypothetical protein
VRSVVVDEVLLEMNCQSSKPLPPLILVGGGSTPLDSSVLVVLKEGDRSMRQELQGVVVVVVVDVAPRVPG